MSEYNNVDNQDSCIEQEIVLQVDNDFGTYNHNALYNKELENQHPIKAITGLTEELELKVDKQEGKDLIDSNLITKLEELDVENIVRDTNYVHTDNNYSNSDRDKLNSIESGAQVNKVNSVNGLTGDIVLDKNNIGLNNVNNTSDLNKPVSNATKIELDKKANKSELSTVAKTGEYKDLINKPTNVSDFNNDTGFITAISSDVLKNKTINASNNIISNIRFENLDVNSTTDEITLTPSTSKLVTENAVSKALSVKANDDEISVVGKTGQYKDLIGEPTNVSAFNNDMGYVVDTDLIPYITTQQVETKLQDYALKQDIPTKTSDLNNDSNFVNNVNLQSELKKKQDTLTFDDIPKIGSNNVVKSGGIYSSLETKANKTELQSGLNSKQDKLLAGEGIEITAENVIKNTRTSTEWGSIVGTLSAQKDLNDKLETKADKSSLSTVATTGSYNDLENKPDIPVLPENITTQGNSFNKSNQLVQLDSEGRMPAIDGSRLTGIVGQKGDKGDTGATGPSNVLTVGSVTKGVEAEVEITGTSPKQVINFVLPQGEKGDTGEQGPVGPPNVLYMGSVTKGDEPSASITGEAPNQVLNLVLPKGDKGDQGERGEQGIQGIQGATGPANTLTIGEVTKGVDAGAYITGNAPNQVLNLVLPKGDKGDQGIQGATGPANVLEIGTVEKGDVASAEIIGEAPNQTLNLVLPKGDKGDQGIQGEKGDKGDQGIQGEKGEKGDTGTISVGSTTTGESGTSAQVVNTGTSTDAIFNFTIPKGDIGPQGPKGDTGTISVGTVSTGDAGTEVIIENSGTASDAILDFTIPKGDKGEKGDQGEQGPQGIKGDRGDVGPSNVLSIGTVTKGEEASASISGVSPNQTLNLVLPKGDKGDTGERGPQGEIGLPNTLTIGSVTKGDEPSAEITGDAPNQVLNLVLPKGDKGDTGVKGDTGATGPANTLIIGTVESGTEANVTIEGEAPSQMLNFVLPKGDKGDKGETGSKGDQGEQGPVGPSNVLTIGSVTTGEKSSVEITGQSPNQVLNFVLEKGEKGDQGEQGPQGATGTQGEKGEKGDKGDTGPQGLKGDTGQGLVAGGTTGQILAKKSDTDYDTEWIDAPSGSEGGIYQNQIECKYANNEPLSKTLVSTPISTEYSIYTFDTNNASYDSIMIDFPLNMYGWNARRGAGYVYTSSLSPSSYSNSILYSNIDKTPHSSYYIFSGSGAPDSIDIANSDPYGGGAPWTYSASRYSSNDSITIDTTKTITFELKLIMNSVKTITFPSSVKWLNDESPDLSQTGVYYFAFRTDDGGTTWYGNSQGRWSL